MHSGMVSASRLGLRTGDRVSSITPGGRKGFGKLVHAKINENTDSHIAS